jgi:isopropylmalate/homocitrate/citramalate synthase
MPSGSDRHLILHFFLRNWADSFSTTCSTSGHAVSRSWLAATAVERANNMDDFRLVKEARLAETGMLTSCSDYHIFNKLKFKSRKQCMDQYEVHGRLTAISDQEMEARVREFMPEYWAKHKG